MLSEICSNTLHDSVTPHWVFRADCT